MGGIDQSVSPGIGGFLAFFLLAVALWLLMRSMIGHLRNVKYLEEVEEERAARDAGEPVVTRPAGGARHASPSTPPAAEPPTRDS